ncbi:DUF2752 domain-containing protein [Sphingobacterium sp. lm-10]|uniref:DUF2752 domain-containing protein n=1 Tax=Sphingobacterium sp. lm-10 TaxID=2944904 RepID=UPI002021C6AB|nr:DUF2752 domain-containing protein [Sphingobacterium sp. lm-10]MCL7988299.1 DUF2752 domain-containing protein [Sphingobacterium sp. lm-10]
MKYATDVPCPSCGATRSVIFLTKGDFTNAFLLNPIGYMVVIIMLIAPIWILADWTTKRRTFLDFFKKMEDFLRRPSYAIPLILLVVVNWIWNIAKGL